MVDLDTALSEQLLDITVGQPEAQVPADMADWLATPTPGTSSFRSGVLLRFFFSYRMHPDQVRSLLADYRSALAAQVEEHTAIMDKLAALSTPAARAGRLAALHRLRTAEARLQWVEEAEAQLEDDSR